MRSLSIREQNRRIQAIFPRFELTQDSGRKGVWEGPLTPIMCPYRTRVTYFRYRFPDARTHVSNQLVSVQIVDPVIGRNPRRTGECAPHVYRNDAAPDYPYLCLYDPRERPWRPDDYIAETIIPWASEWLFFFEGWLVTGNWEGGGRHPE